MKRYSRKKFLRTGALAALSGASIMSACNPGGASPSGESSGAPAIGGKKYRWKMVTTWPAGFPVVGEGAEYFAEKVRIMSGGRLDIKVYGDKELVPAFETFDAVSSGAAQILSGSAYYWAGKVPEAQFFSTVPFGMNAQQMNAWLYNGGGLELWEETYAPFNLLPMPGGNTGVQMGGWFNKEINSMEDFNGLKMRIPGLGGEVFKKAGGTPVAVPGSEIYTNLETGVLDATEWISPYHDFKMGFADIAKYYYAPGWHEPGTTLEIAINKSQFESLPPDLQEILRSAATWLNMWSLSEFEAQNRIYLEKILNEKSIEIREFPKEVLVRLRELTGEVLADITAKNPRAKRIYDAYATYQNQAREWAKWSERAYYQSM